MKEKVIVVLMFFVTAIAIALIACIPVKLLWNWLMPELFGLKEITIFQALGICLLSNILFSSKSNNSNKD